jgi:hypothetical protein
MEEEEEEEEGVEWPDRVVRLEHMGPECVIFSWQKKR